MATTPQSQNFRYFVRWLKTGDPQWQTLKATDDLVLAREWRDTWRKSSTCEDIVIFDAKNKKFVS